VISRFTDDICFYLFSVWCDSTFSNETLLSRTGGRFACKNGALSNVPGLDQMIFTCGFYDSVGVDTWKADGYYVQIDNKIRKLLASDIKCSTG